MPTATKTERDEARATLLKYLKPGDTVYTILRSVSKSGMRRVISVLVLRNGPDDRAQAYHLNFAAATLLGLKQDQHNDGLVVDGAGMDMGFSIVYNLAAKLFGDGYDLRHEWL